MKEQNLTQQIIDYIQAGYTAFYLKTTELARADRLISEVANQLRFNVIEYNLAYGRVKFENKESIDDSLTSFEKIFNHLRHEDLENNLILIKDAKLGLENNPVALARLKYLLDTLNDYKGESAVILQSADVYLPNEIEPLVTLLELLLPDQNQIQAVLKQEKIANELTDRLTTTLSGLNELDIQQLLNLLKNKYGKLNAENEKAILAEIQQQKEQIIAKSGVLEMAKVNEEIEDIGGLEKLKAWLQDQSYIVKNLQAAKEFGVKAPKGTLIAGMPGCGKSLTAKAAAALFQQPLLRLDIGSLLGKYVGESETNMRKALAMAESISPCVLWVDELEKAFVGMTGNNASEVSSRLLGYFLTWLQEKSAPVFIIATANDITALPPELLRKGRFDEIFYVGFPTKKERKKIIEIHLAKAKQKASQFDLDELVAECRDYAGADIENAIFYAVKKAFIQQGKLTQELLLEAIRNTTPLRKTLKDKVGEYEKKFDELYLSPASENDDLSIPQMIKMAEDTNYLERLKVAKNEDVTEEILEKLAKDENLDVRKAVFSNPRCPAKLVNWKLQLDREDEEYDEEFEKILLSNPNISFELAMKKLCDNDDYFDLLSENISLKNNNFQNTLLDLDDEDFDILLAISPYVSENSQVRIYERNNRDVIKYLIENERLCESVQISIIQNSDYYDLISDMVDNVDLSEKAQNILVEETKLDDYEDIFNSIIENKKLYKSSATMIVSNPDILEYITFETIKLIASSEELIKENINLQLELINLDDIGLMQDLAENPNLCNESALMIVNKVKEQFEKGYDEDWDNVLVNLSNNTILVENNKSLQIEIVKFEESAAISQLIENIQLCKEAADIILNSPYDCDKEMLAEYIYDPQIQLRLSKLKNNKINRRLSENKNLHDSVIFQLLKTNDSEIIAKLKLNGNLSEKMKRKLVKC
ncbi:AAA family ATPase [Haemophilus sp.]